VTLYIYISVCARARVLKMIFNIDIIYQLLEIIKYLRRIKKKGFYLDRVAYRSILEGFMREMKIYVFYTLKIEVFDFL